MSPMPIEGTLHYRNYFYVGQEYVPRGKSAVVYGQIYVERLVPATVTQPYPLLFLHGYAMSGANFLNTPDGRMGWVDYFLSKGFEIYLIDEPSRGRSAWVAGVDGKLSTVDHVTTEERFTAPENYNLWPSASLHTQWPGSGTAGDPIFDSFYASGMPSLSDAAELSEKIKAAGSKLLDKIGPVILITHSQAGQFGWILGDSRPSLVKGMVNIEPGGPPFVNAVFIPLTPARPFGLTEIPITYDPPITSASDLVQETVETTDLYIHVQQASPARKMINLVEIPELVITAEASYHSVYDHCTVDFLRQAGVPVEHVVLANVGIHGNGHMLFMESNGLEIAETIVLPWLQACISPVV